MPHVVTVVNPEQSQVSYSHGPRGLTVEVFLTIESHLDIDCRMKSLALDVEMANERLKCRYHGFLPVGQTYETKEIGGLSVKARESIKGWALFQYGDDMRIADFVKFIFTAQAIGEPKQMHEFEPYDWSFAREGQSTVVIQEHE